jgi:purine-binding chemotaxis protein CheW
MTAAAPPQASYARAAAAGCAAGDPGRRAHGGTYLLFLLGGAEYGISVANVREIIGALPITRVPCMPAAVRGVINLRGRIIPVVDLRVRFGLEPVDHGERTCIVVVETGGADLGLVVDRVVEVAHIPADAVEAVPSFAAEADTGYLLGIGGHGSRVRLLLDVEHALPRHDLAALASAAASASASASPAAPAAAAP